MLELNMNVIVFGASGATGRELVKQGVAQGYSVTAFVRNPARFDIQHPSIRVHQGDVADRAAVERAIQRQDEVVCALGGSSLLRRNSALVVGVHNIVLAMELAGVRRLVYLSNDAVCDARMNVFRRSLVSILLHNVAADHDLDESMIKQSHLDWTIVRPPMLTKGERTGSYRSGDYLEPRSLFPQISRADIAQFMLKQLSEDAFLHGTPVVMY
jgi:putative NADH-flavin reductase